MSKQKELLEEYKKKHLQGCPACNGLLEPKAAPNFTGIGTLTALFVCIDCETEILESYSFETACFYNKEGEYVK